MTLKEKIAYREDMRTMAKRFGNLLTDYHGEAERIDQEIRDGYHWRIVKNAERLFRRNKHDIN